MITLSEGQVGELLLGRKVELSIGEPWDFESEDGENVLKGIIVAVRGAETDHRDQEVVLETTLFTASTGHRIDRLVASARYEDQVGIMEHLARGEDAEVNFDYSDQVPEGERDPKSLPFLIGGFHLLRGFSSGT